jgi:hypothetical protein
MLTKKIALADGQWVELKKPVYRDVLAMREMMAKQEKGDSLDDNNIIDFLAPLIHTWSYAEPVSRDSLEVIDYQNVVAMFYAVVALCRPPGELLKNFAAL